MIHPHDIFSPSEPWTIRIVSLAKAFRDKGHEIKLAYCPLSVNEERWDINLENIEIIPLSRKAGLQSLFYNIKKVKEVARWAQIIHFQKCFHYISVPALICGWLLNKPVHYDWDDWEEKIWYRSNKKSIHTLIFGSFIKLLERLIPRLADTVSASSRKLEDLCTSFGVKRDYIFKAPVGADLKKFGPHISGKSIRSKYGLQKKMTILYLGQLHGGQYVSMFIEAANIVLHRYPNTVFLIVGQGFMLSQLKEFVLRLGIEDKLIFTGSVPHELIPQYIAASDICIACFEDNDITRCKSPLKIVEYMAMGKVIVASNVGEARRMLGGVAILVEPGNFQSLAEGILRLLNDKKLKNNLGSFARQRAEKKYNWSVTAENIISAYQKSSFNRKF